MQNFAPAAEVPAATATAVDASNYPEDIFWVKKFKNGKVIGKA